MEEFQYRQNALWCEETDLKRVAEQCGTPVYVYSRRSILDHCRHIEQAFSGIDHLSCYAVKANANKEILRCLSAEGIGADAGSIGEMQLALSAGFPPEKITFSGVGKRDDEIEFALVNNIMSLNVESAEEIEIVNAIAARCASTARILLRINFDIDSDTHPYITTGKRHNKFGVHRGDAAAILKRAMELAHVEVLGVHSHIGSQITRADTFVVAAGEMTKYVEEMKRQGITIRQLNFGGGFGVQYKDYLSHPLLPPEEDQSESGLATVAILNAVVPMLKQTRCKILIQPGRSLVAHAGILLTKVLYMKSTRDKTFVIVDAGMNDLIRPSLYQSYHQIAPLTLTERPHTVVDVVGPLCESGDFLALDRRLPLAERNEYLAVMCAGAYGYVLSSNYNGRPRPPEVMVQGDHFEVIRKRESIRDL